MGSVPAHASICNPTWRPGLQRRATPHSTPQPSAHSSYNPRPQAFVASVERLRPQLDQGMRLLVWLSHQGNMTLPFLHMSVSGQAHVPFISFLPDLARTCLVPFRANHLSQGSTCVLRGWMPCFSVSSPQEPRLAGTHWSKVVQCARRPRLLPC